MRRLVILALALLLLASCAPTEKEHSYDSYTLYLAAQLEDSDGGDAIRERDFRVKGGSALSTAELAEKLVTGLLSAGDELELRSPFPAGTSLQKLTVAGGRANVDFSEPYARLSGIDLSIADACLTLTLTQLDGIYAVHITANGRELPYRQTQLLTAADALLSSGEDVIRPINVSLWFLDTSTDTLRAQQQTVALYEGQSRVSAVVDALKRGPAGDDTLQTLLPENFSILSARTEDGRCYVNLSGYLLQSIDETLRAQIVESLSRSILSLSGVEEVQYLVDGENAPQWTMTLAAPEGAAG
ncbi:MAG: GerMN domain-containing protein [Oscillospiraceae bacterium]|nr:GerMN domain-containing protein [Oscillospiraceae bacterium]